MRSEPVRRYRGGPEKTVAKAGGCRCGAATSTAENVSAAAEVASTSITFDAAAVACAVSSPAAQHSSASAGGHSCAAPSQQSIRSRAVPCQPVQSANWLTARASTTATAANRFRCARAIFNTSRSNPYARTGAAHALTFTSPSCTRTLGAEVRATVREAADAASSTTRQVAPDAQPSADRGTTAPQPSREACSCRT